MSDSDSEEDGFGQRLPPLSKAIRDILKRYPSGQIFKELIQNADDAKAKTIHFYVDYRDDFAKDNLLHRKLAAFQGPSLISFNDKKFTDKDWEGIQRLQDSVKADDPFKVGQFGIGFNSVYHITDLPCIVSGNKIGFFEPQKQIWNQSGKSRTLSVIQKKHPNHLKPFQGICEFDSSCDYYPMTLFRFPLRTEEAAAQFPPRKKEYALSDNTYTPDSLLKLLDALRYEAKYLLLFLRSLEQVKVFVIKGGGKIVPIFEAEVDSKSRDELRQNREHLRKRLKEIYTKNKIYGITEHLYFTCNFSINITSYKDGKENEKNATKWIVSNLVGSRHDVVRTTAEKVNVFPTVGTALEIGSGLTSEGRIFCFLPLPSRASTTLPVHVNGTFSLEDNRRDVKWPSCERTEDSAADWNVLLVGNVLPQCYEMLLEKALQMLQEDPSMFYQAIPKVDDIRETKWEGLLRPLYSKLFNNYSCFYSTSKRWVTLREATFIPQDTSEEEMPSDVVCRIMEDRGYYLVKLPPELWEALSYVNLRNCMTILCPSLVRSALKSDYRKRYTNLSNSEKLKLLWYCLSDKKYCELSDLCLVPLADGEFENFNIYGDPVYVCTRHCYLEVLPCAYDCVVSVSENMQLHDVLQDVAKSELTQLRLLEPRVVANLLATKCFSPHVSRYTLDVRSHKLPFPTDWFLTFWKWVQNQDLRLFESLHIVPIGTEGYLSYRKLANCDGVILIQRNERYAQAIIDILKKFNVTCVLQQEMRYVKHQDIFKYLQHFTCEGALKAIQQANPALTTLQSVSISPDEAYTFQNFIRAVPFSMRDVISFLPIFQIVGVGCMPVAINGNEVVYEPPGNVIAPQYLPTNFNLLSRTGNVNSVIQACSIISCPPTLAKFILDWIFPLIEQGTFHPFENITPFMEEVLRIFAMLESQLRYNVLADNIKTLPFLPISQATNSYKCPDELFDPSSNDLRKLYEGQFVFPLSPFDNDMNLVPLRKCGLKTSVSAQDIYNILLDIAKDSQLVWADELDLHRSRYVFDYLTRNEYLFSCQLYAGGYCRKLDQAIHLLARKKSIFAIENETPANYLRGIEWKGSNTSSHLTGIVDHLVLPLCSSNFDMQDIVGSEMYIVHCPSPLCSMIDPVPHVRQVVSHFKKIIASKCMLTTQELTSLSLKTYNYLQLHIEYVKMERNSVLGRQEEKWVWMEELQKFLPSSDIVFYGHETFHHELSPYIYTLPRAYQKYQALFTYYGVATEIDTPALMSILKRIKDDEQTDSMTRWQLVHDILNWVTEDGTMHAKEKVDLNDLLVPVEQQGSSLRLEAVKNVVYTDNRFIKKHFQKKDNSLLFIHQKFEHLSKYLGVAPLSEVLHISKDLFGDAGQHESLVGRIRNILRQYIGELTIIKELLQNADDATATEFKICFDTRTHKCNSDDLFFPGMARAHGPALIVYNNKEFSEDDFRNIQKLAGATKLNQPLKIGKFGVGFCSVYHITDIPSFVSKDFLYIFDPAMEYLKEDIDDMRKPGKSIRYNDEMIHNSEQMLPYRDLFGFRADERFPGTIFRLPLRTNASKISDKCHDQNLVDNLVEKMQEAGPELLLFLTYLKSITFCTVSDTKRETLLRIKKEVVQRVTFAAEIIKISVQINTASNTKESYWLVTEKQSTEQISSIACSLEKEGSHYIPKPIIGEVFCFLPLHLETGLPVHVSANFAVMDDRSGIHFSDSIQKTKQSQFNVDLMCDCIPYAYLNALLALRDMCYSQNYKFFSLWPLKENLKTKNPWEYFIPKLYMLISNEQLCYSEYVSKWLQVDAATVLSPNILHEDQLSAILGVLKQFKKPVLNLPSEYQVHLAFKVFSENDFLSLFFEQFKKIHVATRNKVLLSLVRSYAFQKSNERQDWLSQYPCIPCTPNGKTVKKCKDVVDPKSKIALLYEPKDSMFPIPDFQENLIHATLVSLGMLSSKLPWDMIMERASTVKALYASDKNKSLHRTKTLLSFMEEQITDAVLPDEAEDLKHIPFLPPLQRPQKYPKDLLWAGKEKALVCSSQSLKRSYRYKLNYLVGSQRVIVSEQIPAEGGCGFISINLAKALGINNYPLIDDVVKHLIHTSAQYSSSPKMEQNSIKTVSLICEEVYSYINDHLLNHKSSDHRFIKEFHANKNKLLWNGEEFIHPTSVAKSWRLNGPYLYCIPYAIKSLSGLLEQLKLRESFDRNQLLETLGKIEKNSKNKPISKDQARVVKNISEILAEDEQTNPSYPEGYLYDEKMCMRHIKDLVYNDAPWCKVDTEYFFVHHDFSRPHLEKLGVKLIRSKALERYDTSECHFDGVPFGQREELTQRIKNILDSYIYNETILKELLQNADDAKATKLYFILDERKHGTSKVFSSEWKELQGPAFLVWNDKGFSEGDLTGIQKLGLGSKRSKSESIGQYGIGFNVVYHLTDCPSLLTNGNTLCIFDPHCKYVPGANSEKPGRRLNDVDEKFWEDWSDLKSSYLQDALKGCPNEIKKCGSLFRFLLRSSEDLVKKSKLVDENAKPLQAWKLKEQLKQWAPKLKESLLFLKHVVELCFCTISDSEFSVVHRFKAELDDNAKKTRADLHEKAKKFHLEGSIPFIGHYDLNLIEEKPIKEVEHWLIQQGVGDVNNPSQHWEYLPAIYPMHGLAAQLRGQSFTPKIFCFLPLPLPSKLPVHVNANFILDSSARSDLWKSRDTTSSDDKKKWNDRLIEALGSSYAQFLLNCQKYVFNEPYNKSTMEDLQKDRDVYYNLFPKWLHNKIVHDEMLDLAQHVYKYLAKLKCEVFALTCKSNLQSNSKNTKSKSRDFILTIKWEPVLNDQAADQVYFLEDSTEVNRIRKILKHIGMRVTFAPIEIRKHFEAVSVDIKEATPENVFDYYCLHSHQASSTGSFPCHIGNSKFSTIEEFKMFVKYVACNKESVREVRFQEDDTSETTENVALFPKPPFGFPLLLTADGCVREFDENNLPIKTHFSGLFPKVQEKFLHSELLDVQLSQQYFMKPNPENQHQIFEILRKTLHPSLDSVQTVCNASSMIKINDLKPLWECLDEDAVFSKHVCEIVQKWALILSDKDTLYAYSRSRDHFMPLVRPKSLPTPGTLAYYYGQSTDELERQHKVFALLTAAGMPTVHKHVRKPWNYCPTLDKPVAVLKNLKYLYSDLNQSLPPDILTDTNIKLLFSYFKTIHFMNDTDSLEIIKSLPFFKSVDGRYCHLSGEAYLWPQNVCESGISKILDQSRTVFLASDGAWKILATADVLKIEEINCLQLYTNYIFPHLSEMNEADRLAQLKHIKERLFEHAEQFSTMETDSSKKKLGDSFISGLKLAPFFLKKGIPKPICEFCDPEHPVLKIFPQVYTYPPDGFSDKSWIDFLKKIGLQTLPKPDEFLNFCSEIANGRSQSKEDTRKVSMTLLNCLFKTEEWYNDSSFLQEVSCISFVYPETLHHLSWIIPTSKSNVHYLHHRKSYTALVCLKDSACLDIAELMWTVCPVVKLPPILPFFNTHNLKREEVKNTFYKHLGICSKPDESQVLENIINISKSRFSNFKLFENYPSDCVQKEKCSSLSSVVSKNLQYIQEHFASSKHKLVDVPFIPVSKDCSDSDLSKPVLVKPLQVIASASLSSLLHPFLNPLPDLLYSYLHMLQGMKVNTQIKTENIVYALNLIQSDGIMPMDPNTIDTVKELLKLLYFEIKFHSDTIDASATLFLPDCNCRLIQSCKLIYDDKGYHKDVKYTFDQSQCGSEFSAFSLLCKTRYDEMQDYGFDLKQFAASLLPTTHPMLPFSRYIKSHLKQNCQKESVDSSFAKSLRKAFSMNFAEILNKVMKHQPLSSNSCDQFTTCLQDCLKSINIVTITNLKVDLILSRDETEVTVGEASMDFLLHYINEEPILYIDSKVDAKRLNCLESFSKYFINEIIKKANLKPSSVNCPVDTFVMLLKAENTDDIKDILLGMGLYSPELHIEQKFDYILKPELGEAIPEEWHHRLYADILNSFRPQELVGYETRENCFIFARIEYRLRQASKEDSNSDEDMEMYVIRIRESDGDNDEDCMKTVPQIELYKFLQIKEPEHANESTELKLYDPDNEFTLLWESTKDHKLKDFYHMICEELRRISRISDEDLKRKSLKAMYLKWHPDKNKHPLATKAFQFLQRQIDRMKQGLDLEDPDSTDEPSTPSSSFHYNFATWDWFATWDNLSKQRNRTYQQEQRTFWSSNKDKRSNDWFGYSSGISVLPDTAKAEVWLKQATCDVEALDVMLRESINNTRLSAHVCFLAHQVAEKALKAGMYAKYGLHPDSLKNHDIVPHAHALEQVISNAEGLVDAASLLQNQDCYLKTRYPNRFGAIHKVPSHEYSQEQAEHAAQAGKNIFEIIDQM